MAHLHAIVHKVVDREISPDEPPQFTGLSSSTPQPLRAKVPILLGGR